MATWRQRPPSFREKDWFPSGLPLKSDVGEKVEKPTLPTIVEEEDEDEMMSRLVDNLFLVDGVTFQSMTEFLGLPQPSLTLEGMFEALASEDSRVIEEFNRHLVGDASLVEVPLD